MNTWVAYCDLPILPLRLLDFSKNVRVSFAYIRLSRVPYYWSAKPTCEVRTQVFNGSLLRH